jgi:hypothetical protein
LDIEPVAEVVIKRVVSKEKKPVDPIPSIEDYVKPDYARVKPASEPLVPKREDRSVLVDLDNNRNLNEHDLIRFERIFVSV